ncbi:MAG: hypothetical protein ABIN48_06100 [Ginsengibacter sp.]
MKGQNQIVVNVLGNDYIAKFPNVGQLMDIESMKMALTNNNYTTMAFSGLKVHVFQLDLADAISYFAILIPDLRDNLEIKNWRELDTIRAKKIVESYKKSFLPWFKPLLDDLTKIEEDEPEADKSAESQSA